MPSASLKILYYLSDACETITYVLITDVYTFRWFQSARLLQCFKIITSHTVQDDANNFYTECAIKENYYILHVISQLDLDLCRKWFKE